jgi:hypothetical protein
MTGGKVRDTLAGLFDDRAARRFAYKPLSGALLLIAAFAMLLAVAARRLGVPNVLSALAARSRAWRDDGARRRAERDARMAHEQSMAIEGSCGHLRPPRHRYRHLQVWRSATHGG